MWHSCIGFFEGEFMNKFLDTKTGSIIMVLVGIACDAFSFAAFVLPHKFIAGGVTGIGRVFSHYFGFEVSIVVAIISISLLILGFLLLGKLFALSIVAGSVLFPLFLNVFNRFDALKQLTDQPMLAAIIGGVLMGFGLGLIIRAGASSGGSDVIPIILNRKLGIPVAPLIYIADFTIMILQLPFANTNDVLFGIIVAMLCTITLNKVVLFGSSNVQFTIISHKYKEINAALQNDLDVGSTLTHGITGHCNDPLDVIICVVSHESVHRVRTTVLDIDEEAFMTMVDVSGVNGRGFTMARKY